MKDKPCLSEAALNAASAASPKQPPGTPVPLDILEGKEANRANRNEFRIGCPIPVCIRFDSFDSLALLCLGFRAPRALRIPGQRQEALLVKVLEMEPSPQPPFACSVDPPQGLELNCAMKEKRQAVTVRAGSFEMLKVNAVLWDWRDLYHWLLTLRWPSFVAFLLGVYLAVNVFFAGLFLLGGACIEGMPQHSFSSAFFFSIETLATVGYGHMYPATLYGHFVATAEIVTGMFGTAVMTGLIFVRFSRPTARLLFSRVLVLSNFDGQPALMMRVANQRHQPMAEAEFRLMLVRHEPTIEDPTMYRFHTLPLQVDHLVIFPAAVTIRHLIDERSPLHGVTPASLEKSGARFMASIVCVDKVLHTPVQSEYGYAWHQVRFDERFVEMYTDQKDGPTVVDYARMHDTEPAGHA